MANAIWKHVVVRKSILVNLGLQPYRQPRRLIDKDVVILARKHILVEQ